MYANQLAFANAHAMTMAGNSSVSAGPMPMPDMELWRRQLLATSSSKAAHVAGDHLMAHLSSPAHQQLQQQQQVGDNHTSMSTHKFVRSHQPRFSTWETGGQNGMARLWEGVKPKER
jgi:hypothetical protein